MARSSLLALAVVACAAPQVAAPPPEKPQPADPPAARAPEGSATAEPKVAQALARLGSAAAEDADLDRLRVLEKTRELYLEFLARAEGREDFAEAVARARERLEDTAQEMEFLKQGIAERRLEGLGDSTP